MHLQSVSSREEAIPLGDTNEAFVYSDHRTIASTKAGDSPDHLVGLVVAVLVSFIREGLGRDEYTDKACIDSRPVYSDWTSLTRLILCGSVGAWRPKDGHHSHRDDLFDAWLGNVLSQTPDGFEVPLSIGNTHHTSHPVDLPRLSRVIPSVLRSGQRVVIEEDSNTVFSSPRDGTSEVPIGVSQGRLL